MRVLVCLALFVCLSSLVCVVCLVCLCFALGMFVIPFMCVLFVVVASLKIGWSGSFGVFDMFVICWCVWYVWHL